MNKFTSIAVTALLAATMGTAAFAQESTDFKQADGNKDNAISWEEALGAIPTLTEDQFKTADANGDGSLDEGEFLGLVTLFGGPSTESSAAQ